MIIMMLTVFVKCVTLIIDLKYLLCNRVQHLANIALLVTAAHHLALLLRLVLQGVSL